MVVASSTFIKRSASQLLKSAQFMTKMSSRPSSDMAGFKRALDNAKNVVILTGAGVSAESGVPTFRGAGGYWRRYQVLFMRKKTMEALNSCDS